MDLVNEYLRAVAALLPKAQRDDITAELRDTILNRIEEREAERGRPLTDDEIEAVLREVGHPLVVAARYREGPQHVVGPTLYPYWLFAVKAAIALQVVVALVVIVVRTMAFDDMSRTVGHAIGSGITGALVLIGAATCAAWFIERRGARIDYLENWRVRDLRYLEIASWDFASWRDWFVRQGHGPHTPGPAASKAAAPPGSATTPQPQPPHQPPPWEPDLRPAARGLGAIAVGTVLVLWWIGVLPLDLSLSPADWASLDLDPGAFADANWPALKAMLFWPVLAYGAILILQGAVMLAHPWAVRLQGLVEMVKGVALLGFCVWLWTISPLAGAIAVADLGELVQRMVMFADSPPLPVEPIATLVVLGAGFSGGAMILRGLWMLMAGPPPMYGDGPWRAGRGAVHGRPDAKASSDASGA